MIELLHPEVDIKPGQNAPKGSLPSGSMGTNCAVVRLLNDTDNENLFTVKLECGQRYWKEDWYTLDAMDRPLGQDSPASKKPVYSQGKKAVQVYVPKQSSWEVRIIFFVPEHPTSRAGKYAFRVLAERNVSSTSAQRERKEAAGLAVVRPYYNWSIEVDPQIKKAKIYRTKAKYDLIVSNKGNDWLYCDALFARNNKDLDMLRPTETLAVPPPEPGEDAVVRRIPVVAISKTRVIRGEQRFLNLGLSVRRVDAPTVPSLSDEALLGTSTMNIDDPVLGAETSDTLNVSQDCVLIYCPPIPSTLTGFIGALAQNGKSLVFTFIGLFIAMQMFLMVLVKYQDNEMRKRELRIVDFPKKGSSQFLILEGKYLLGSVLTGNTQVTLIKKPGNIDKDVTPIALEDGKPVLGSGRDGLANVSDSGANVSKSMDKVKFDLATNNLKEGTYTVSVQRMHWLGFLTSLITQKIPAKSEFTYGNVVDIGLNLEPDAFVGIPYTADITHGSVTINTFTINQKPVKAVNDGRHIKFTVSDYQQGKFGVSINGKSIGTLNVKLAGEGSTPDSIRSVMLQAKDPDSKEAVSIAKRANSKGPNAEAMAVIASDSLDLKQAEAALKLGVAKGSKEAQALAMAVIAYHKKNEDGFTEAVNLNSKATIKVLEIQTKYYVNLEPPNLVQALITIKDALKYDSHNPVLMIHVAIILSLQLSDLDQKKDPSAYKNKWNECQQTIIMAQEIQKDVLTKHVPDQDIRRNLVLIRTSAPPQ